VGLPGAKYVKERGFETYGYEIKLTAIGHAKEIAGIKQATDFGSEDTNIFIITVSTH
jgi:hypothetical protein